MNCPKCSSEMKTVHHGGVRLDTCGGCGGWLVDRGVLDDFAAKAGKESVRLVPGGPTRFDCSICPGVKLLSGTIGDVAVEHCSDCGSVYLDNDELRRVAKKKPKQVPMVESGTFSLFDFLAWDFGGIGDFFEAVGFNPFDLLD